jgi:hypothetical protein
MNKYKHNQNWKMPALFWPALFIAARLIILLSLPWKAISAYGDYWNFFNQSSLGMPYLHFWTEFPPIFPFLSKLIFELVDGRESAYSYALAFVISLFQAGSIAVFFNLEKKINPDQNGLPRVWVYFALVIGLFYSWSYFDPIAVFFLLLGIALILDRKDELAAVSIAAGVLTKWFPLLVIPVLWKTRPIKEAFRITIFVIGIVILVWGALYLINPEMTGASLVSQVNKGSWETIWALFDNNIRTGNFGAVINRQIANTAKISTGNPSLIPSWLTLLVMGGLGLGLLLRSKNQSASWIVSFVGFSIVLFFLWSPGYSPQWVLYLLPFILLCLPEREAYLLGASLVLVNLLEWPVLLSRGYFWSLYFLIPIRTLMMILLGVRLYQRSIGTIDLIER